MVNYHEEFADLDKNYRFQMNPNNGIQGDYRNSLMGVYMTLEKNDMGLEGDFVNELRERLAAVKTYTDYQTEFVGKAERKNATKGPAILQRLLAVPRAPEMDALVMQLRALGNEQDPFAHRERIEKLLADASAIIDEGFLPKKS